MKVKDFQFVKYVLSEQMALPTQELQDLLERHVWTASLSSGGEPDSITVRNTGIALSNPTSITKTIFNMLYGMTSDFAGSDFHKDKLALVLFEMCRQYVYKNYDEEVKNRPPVMISYDKLLVPSLVMHEILEPLAGNIELPKIFFIDCPFTDCCRVVESSDKLARNYDIDRNQVNFQHSYPLLLVNSSVYNDAAKQAHVLFKTIEMVYGVERAQKLLKFVILDDKSVHKRLNKIIRMVNGSLSYAVDFVQYLRSHACLDEREKDTSINMEIETLEADKHFGSMIKEGQDAYYTPQVYRQWSQWSMLLGLIENQLKPMRGSIWPASENLGPIEDEKRARMIEKAKKLNKEPSELTFQELLQVSRDWYNHNAIEPGKLYEELLKEQRAWKV